MSLTVSIMNGVTNSHPTTSEEANGLATDFVSEGVIGTYTNTGSAAPTTGAFSINAQGTPDMTVAVGSGVAYVQGTPASQNSQMFRVYNSASENVTISANSSGSTKYDWLYIKLDATLLNAPTLAGTTTATLVTSRSTSSSSDDGTPPTYGYPIAVITVSNGASSITNSVIRDIRGNADIGTVAGQNTGWTSGALPAVSSVTENGNRSANITFASTVASLLTPGMRIRTSRTAPAPTQCTDLESGSSQYFSKTTPNKLTFTDDFTCMGWVKVESYTKGGIIARRNADTEGWSLYMDTTGQIIMESIRIAGNYSTTTSYQSLPLNKWVHVAATTDLSGTSVLLYIDGVLVPSATVITGTITALVQGTTALVVGAVKSAGTNPFDGKIAQAAVFDAVLSASTIRSYKNQTLSGSETNLKSAYSFNNAITDLNTTTPNDLTANGAAVATNADSPFTVDANGVPGGTYDWAIVTKVATTVATVQYPEGCAIPTSGGISTVDYSGVKSPFGMPVDSNRWRVETIVRTLGTQSSPVASTWYNLTGTSGASGGHVLVEPIGAWRRGYEVSVYTSRGAGTVSQFTGLSTANNTQGDARLSVRSYGSSLTELMAPHKRESPYTTSSATTLYLNVMTDAASVTAIQFFGQSCDTLIYSDCAYL